MSLLLPPQAAPVPIGAAVHAAADTVIVQSPLPGGIAEVVRFIFGVPRWVMITGIVLGVIAGVALAILLWRRRQRILDWLRLRPRRVQVGLGAGALIVVLAAAGSGRASWNYMQHDNGFCTGCHIMEDPFKAFAVGAGKHDALSCHDCHNQSIFASSWQLYLWIAERPDKIEQHAIVPSATCTACHMTGVEGEAWTRIASTAGHRVHLESDSLALKDVQCVTCHGLEIHKFVPVDKTCGQSGCHDVKEIKLGKMAEQTSLHCATCHQFTLDVPALATRDSAAGTLVPNRLQCLSCHEMQGVLKDFDPVLDPHAGTCGMCHNPHEQTTATEAKATCTTAGCHDNWQAEPFHTGQTHRKVSQDCTTCHLPHSAQVDASDCEACHRSVRERTGSLRIPPLPFDTTRALRGAGEGLSLLHSSPPGAPLGPAGKGDALQEQGRPPPPDLFGSAADSFPHSPHNRLACLTCHTTESQHGRLTFTPPRGCLICHHQSPGTNQCETCHRPATLGAPLAATVDVQVGDRAAVRRSVGFRHEAHPTVKCLQCHSTAVTMAPAAEAKTCVACHEDHHTVNRSCGTCHTRGNLPKAHTTPREAHTACSACHTAGTIDRLTPTRAFCTTCHLAQADTSTTPHYPARECSTCHFLAAPDILRPALRTRPLP